MNAYEISQFSQAIAWHPLVAIGGLIILVSIARRMDIKYKEGIEKEKVALDKSILNSSQQMVNNDMELLPKVSVDTNAKD